MTSIERTAYPRLKKNLSGADLRDYYTPTVEETFFVQTARTDESRLHLLAMLKTFQRLGYFPDIEEVPEKLVRHLRSFLKYGFNILPIVGKRTLYKHHHRVRQRLNIKSFDKTARKTVINQVYEAAATMDNPADLVNVAIEQLIKERYELPAFSTLDRLVRRVRTLVNRRLFQTTLGRLSSSQINTLDNLLLPDAKAFRTGYNRLKTLPKKATLKHLQELLSHLDWLTQKGNFNEILKDVPPLKVKHFAGEAKAIDAREIKDFTNPKRYALLVCLVHRAHVKTETRSATC
jgi:hypothetical protein